VSRSDRDQRDAERAARRARRLAERAKQRAQRRAEQAEQAAERADRLAERAGKRSRRSIEDYVDDVVDDFDGVAERLAKKAEGWFDSDKDRSRGSRSRRTSASERPGRRQRRSTRRRSFRSRLNSGRGLYRDKAHGKICGVCAGVADYLDVDTWQVRLVAVLGLIFVPSVAITVYFITYFLMDDKPYYRRMTDGYDDVDEDDDDFEEEAMTSKSNGAPRPAGSSPSTRHMSNVEALQVAKDKFSNLEGRLRSMESHVTSSRFELQRELKKISAEDA